MSDVEKKLNELGYTLPKAPAKGGVYTPCKLFHDGRLAYVSGCVSITSDTRATGKAGRNVSLEDAQKASRIAMLNVLAVLKEAVGDLDNIKSCVKATVFINCTDNFYDHPKAANAATELLVAIFGEEAGCPSRSAVGVSSLPGNVTAEIEMLVELNLSPTS